MERKWEAKLVLNRAKVVPHPQRVSVRVNAWLRRKSNGKGSYANIHAKRKRIAAGSGEKMRKAGAKGAPTAKAFKKAAKTAKKKVKK